MKKLRQYIREESEKPGWISRLFEFGTFLLFAEAQFHLDHFQVSSGFIHETLGELYEKCDDWADDIIEKTCGMADGNLAIRGGNFELKTYDGKEQGEFAPGASLELLKQIKEKCNELMGCNDEGIKNILGGMLEDLLRFEYKLERLH